VGGRDSESAVATDGEAIEDIVRVAAEAVAGVVVVVVVVVVVEGRRRWARSHMHIEEQRESGQREKREKESGRWFRKAQI
jgi:hypothetical protein